MEEKEVLNTTSNRKTADMETTHGAESIMVKKQIGKTMFLVCVHFSGNSKETLQDKINRLLRNEIREDVL